jgi:hypothetical protein
VDKLLGQLGGRHNVENLHKRIQGRGYIKVVGRLKQNETQQKGSYI